MDPGLRTAASGMEAQQQMIDVIANNIANVNTTGFKRSRASFEDLLYETIQGARVETPEEQQTLGPIQIGMGTRLSAVVRLDTQGTPQQTGRTLDVAIQGDGYFQVQRPDGTIGYTRDGSFTLSDTGQVVTSDGYPLIPSLVIPSDSQNLAISSSGVVTITNTGGKTTQIGQIELARFLNSTGLEDLGQNQYGQTAASGEPIQGAPMSTYFGSVLQGNLESSNVDIVQEMTDMITAQRAYEINAKAVQTSETMLDDTNALIR
jgi:flagellar basal-body rod protein FlgG